MSQLLYSLPLLACPLGMGLMMYFMMRSGKHSAEPPKQPSAPIEAEIASLRTEVEHLRAARAADHQVP